MVSVPLVEVKAFRSLRAWLARMPLPGVSDLILASFACGYLIWILLWQYTQFVEGAFGYHDLTIINDFFSNAWKHGRPFWVTNAQEMHLRIHFTPSLLLLAPAFLFFKSQFALIATSATAVCAGIFLAARSQLASLRRLGIAPVWCVLLTAAFFVAYAGNRYTLRVVSSAHFEPVFILTASLLLASVSRGAAYRTFLPLLGLALGVRQDAGFFLFFLLLSCLFAPRAFGEFPRFRVIIGAAICLAYVIVASKFIMPWFGNDGSTRFWHHWGDTWPQVFLSWAREPERVYEAVNNSEFGAFNAELSYAQVINPFAWVLTQAPGLLFYTADAGDKPWLLFYNSAFLLPGLLLCLAFAQLHTVTLALRLTTSHPRVRTLCLAILCGGFAYVGVAAALSTPRGPSDTLRVGELVRHDVFTSKSLRKLLRCREVRSVATDFRTIAFAPLWTDKYLLQNARTADLVVSSRSLSKHTPLYIKPKHLVRDLTHDGAYSLVGSFGEFDFYRRSTLQCR